MKTQRIASVLAAVCIVLLVGCNLPAGLGGAGPRTWIDAPLDGMTFPLGTIVVRSHAASEGGTARAALLVNGAQVRLDNATDTASPLIEITQPWLPAGPGDYVLQVVSTDNAGNEGRSNEVHVRVGELPEATDTPAPVTGTPATATTGPTVTATTSAGPSITFTVPANCRQGSSTAYEVVTAFLAGTNLPIQGRNADTTWFWVPVAGGGLCAVSGSTGTLQGPYQQVPVLPDPPLPPTATATTTPQQPAPQQPPNAPAGFGVTELICTSEAYTVRLGWKDVDGEDGYRVYREGGLIATLGADQTVYDDTPGDYEAHTYRVEAFNGAGSGGTGNQNSTGCLY
jgi:hypothetical protein